jgi:hypothetical protein
MGGNGLIASKKSEIVDIAKKYGVDRYIGTDRLAVADVLIKTWAEDVRKDDPLLSNTKWVETKAEIEDIIAEVALENNSRQSMYLLGATQTGKVSLNEVKEAYVVGWNTLLEQYSKGISQMSQSQLMDLERDRDRYLATIPEYGSMSEKSFHSTAAASSLAQAEQSLIQFTTASTASALRGGIAHRETTRTLLLAEAESGMQDGGLTPGQYKQIISLIGRGPSLYAGQMATLSQFSNNPQSLMDQIDRTLRKAGQIVSNKESRYALAGVSGFVSDPRTQQMNQTLGRTGMTGDGIRSVKMEDQILKTIPQIIAHAVPSGIGNPPWVGMNNAPPESTIILKENANHAKFMNPADINRGDLTSKFSAYHQQRLQSPNPSNIPDWVKFAGSPANNAKLNGIYAPSTRGFGGGALETVSDSRVVQLGLVVALGYFGVQALKTFQSKTYQGPMPPPIRGIKGGDKGGFGYDDGRVRFRHPSLWQD